MIAPDASAPFVDTTTSFRQLLDMLRNRYLSLVFTTGVAAVVMVCVARATAPTYTATSRLLVDPINYAIQQLDSGNPLSNIIAAGAEHSVGTQAHIINSSGFQEDVYRSLSIRPAEAKAITSLNAAPEERSDTEVINITVTGTSADLVARVATGAARRYVERSHEAKL